MRIYVPSTQPAVQAILAAGGLHETPIHAYAVTPQLRAQLGDDEEELEYAALSLAADASVYLLAADPQAPRRRVVLAADVTEGAVSPVAADFDAAEDGDDGADIAAVTVHEPVPMRRVAAGHIDDDDPAVTANVARAAANGEAHLVENHELLWHATQELA